LPSYADMVALKKNPSVSTNLTGTYWTSTEEERGKSWAITLPAGTMVVADKTTAYRVRCVRGKGTEIPEATMESGEDDHTKINLSAEKGANGLFKITDDKDFGLPWTVTSNAADWLKIATDDKGTAAETSQTGTGDVTLYTYTSAANTAIGKRSANLTLTRGGMTKALIVNQNYFEPLKGGNSNCYMVTPGNTVNIPVERANESFLALTGSVYNATTQTYYQLMPETHWTACLVWESDKGLVTLSQNTGVGSLGHFKVTAGNASKQGNAVVAIKNEKDEILWSWHIWVTDYDGTTIFTTNNGKQNFVFMDRALGATSATAGELSSCGLLYQWGRKDPFPGIGQEGGSWAVINDTDPVHVYNTSGTADKIDKKSVPNVVPNNLTNATRHPNTLYYNANAPYDWFVYKSSSTQNSDLWSGSTITLINAAKKSVFDPCPSGWRIPIWLNSTSPYHGMATGGSWSSSNHGMSWNDADGYFPASGFRDSYKSNINGVNTIGCYWTGTPKNTISYNFYYKSGEILPENSGNRSGSFPVRCCKDNL
ncbi:MAG: hypothetical protein RR528_03830, partial [Angelakisella sp.]